MYEDKRDTPTYSAPLLRLKPSSNLFVFAFLDILPDNGMEIGLGERVEHFLVIVRAGHIDGNVEVLFEVDPHVATLGWVPVSGGQII